MPVLQIDVAAGDRAPTRVCVERPHFRAENIELSSKRFAFEWRGKASALALQDIVLVRGALRVNEVAHPQPLDLRRRLSFAPMGVVASGWCEPTARVNRVTMIAYDQAHLLEQLEINAAPKELPPLVHIFDTGIEATLKQLARAIAEKPAVEDVLIDALLLTAAAEITRLAHARSQSKAGVLTAAQATRIYDLVEARLAGPLSLHDMAQAAGLSDYHFGRAFKQTTGLSPYRYLLVRRVEHAKDLIAAGKPMAEVIVATGFSGPSQFSRTFKAIAGESPRAFRKRA